MLVVCSKEHFVFVSFKKNPTIVIFYYRFYNKHTLGGRKAEVRCVYIKGRQRALEVFWKFEERRKMQI